MDTSPHGTVQEAGFGLERRTPSLDTATGISQRCCRMFWVWTWMSAISWTPPGFARRAASAFVPLPFSTTTRPGSTTPSSPSPLCLFYIMTSSLVRAFVGLWGRISRNVSGNPPRTIKDGTCSPRRCLTRRASPSVLTAGPVHAQN